jgi:hypothetical protein
VLRPIHSERAAFYRCTGRATQAVSSAINPFPRSDAECDPTIAGQRQRRPVRPAELHCPGTPAHRRHPVDVCVVTSTASARATGGMGADGSVARPGTTSSAELAPTIEWTSGRTHRPDCSCAALHLPECQPSSPPLWLSRSRGARRGQHTRSVQQSHREVPHVLQLAFTQRRQGLHQ